MPSGHNSERDAETLIRKANCGVPLDRAELFSLLGASGVSISLVRLRQLEARAIKKLAAALVGSERVTEDPGPVVRKRRRRLDWFL